MNLYQNSFVSRAANARLIKLAMTMICVVSIISLAGCHWSVQESRTCGNTCHHTTTVGVGGTFPGAITDVANALSVNSLDVATYHILYDTKNVVMTNGTYAGTLSLYNSDGNLIASRSLNYYVYENTARVSNPQVVQSWIDSHDVNVAKAKIHMTTPYTATSPNASSGLVSGRTYMGGQLIGASSATFQLKGGYCPKPNRCIPTHFSEGRSESN